MLDYLVHEKCSITGRVFDNWVKKVPTLRGYNFIKSSLIMVIKRYDSNIIYTSPTVQKAWFEIVRALMTNTYQNTSKRYKGLKFGGVVPWIE